MRAALRTQAVPAGLHCHLHRQLLHVRRGHHTRHDFGCPRGAGRGRRRAAAYFTGDSAGEFPAGKTRAGHGAVWPGRGSRPDSRTHAGRISDRCLLLALGVLHQHSGGNFGDHHDFPLRPGSRLHSQCKARSVGWNRSGTAGGMARLHAGRSRQGPGRRLVWRGVDPLGNVHYGGLLRGIRLAHAIEKAPSGEPARLLPSSQLYPGMLF